MKGVMLSLALFAVTVMSVEALWRGMYKLKDPGEIVASCYEAKSRVNINLRSYETFVNLSVIFLKLDTNKDQGIVIL